MKHTTLRAWPGQTDRVPGYWRLVQGRAMSLSAGQDARLLAVSGGLWVTLNLPQVGPGNASGDYFLSAGETLTVPAGSHVVMESWAQAGSGDAQFDWATVPAQDRVAVRWQVGVRQPLADLRAGLGAVGVALLGLATGLAGVLAGFATDLVAATARPLRGGVGFRALMAVSSAPKAQGRIS